MNFINALHSLGLGSIPLNWSARSGRDKKMKKLLGLPDNYIIIMLLGIGELPSKIKVPLSKKKATTDIFLN